MVADGGTSGAGGGGGGGGGGTGASTAGLAAVSCVEAPRVQTRKRTYKARVVRTNDLSRV